MNRNIPINLRLPEKLIIESDQLAQQEGSNRSEIVRNALRSYIERRKIIIKAREIVKQAGKQNGINSQEDLDQVMIEWKEKRREKKN
jgi:metal-responsive CopG/Arc/MetJ family transcriptional regulator